MRFADYRSDRNGHSDTEAIVTGAGLKSAL
jgi:hypothetical protein